MRTFALVVLAVWLPGSANAREAIPARHPSPVLQALVIAGGGPDRFKTLTLVDVLAGPDAGDVLAKLTATYGAVTLKRCIVALDGAVADVTRAVQRGRLVWPANSEPDAGDGRALLRALEAAGNDRRRSFDAGEMLTRLTPYRLGRPPADRRCLLVLTDFMHALAAGATR